MAKVCDEAETRQVMNEFKMLYESKLQAIPTDSGDVVAALEAKLRLQQDWITDLTAQNDLLVRTVAELEAEATDRVDMLEKKLRRSIDAGNEVMRKYRDMNMNLRSLDVTYQKLRHFESDVQSLLEFIRRVREDRCWCTDGMHFYTVAYEDIFGKEEFPPGPNVAQNTGVGDQSQVQIILERDAEMNKLKRSMMDMRNALTVEVAEKHDTILNLRRDVQQLEEQVRQSNKQMQFKEDIIKELRKEVKQLRSQQLDDERTQAEKTRRESNALLNTLQDKQAQNRQNFETSKNQFSEELEDIRNKYEKEKQELAKQRQITENLTKTLQESGGGKTNDSVEQCKHYKERMAAVLRDLDEARKEIELLKTGTISDQSSGAAAGEADAIELAATLKKERKERENERERRNQEMQNLKNTIAQLEQALANAQGQSRDLKQSVDIYKTTIRTLDIAGEKTKVEMSFQKRTIANLQEALVVAKQQLSELQLKVSSEVSWTSWWLGSSVPKPNSDCSKFVHDI